MRPALGLGAAVLGAAALATSPAVSAPAWVATPHPTRHVVEVRGFEFRPARLELAAGDTVVWVNHDMVPHTATADDGSWDSGDLEEGESWSYVSSVVGRQPYDCALHPTMRGELVIR